jgi:hypothetical protein
MLTLDSVSEVHDNLHGRLSLLACVKMVSDAFGRVLFPQSMLQRPAWFRFSDRSWNRHSAFIMLQHKHLNEGFSDG